MQTVRNNRRSDKLIQMPNENGNGNVHLTYDWDRHNNNNRKKERERQSEWECVKRLMCTLDANYAWDSKQSRCFAYINFCLLHFVLIVWETRLDAHQQLYSFQ